MTVSGSGFAQGGTQGAVVRWNGSPLTTTFVGATRSVAQLSASVPASLLIAPGTATITVSSQGLISNAASFTIAGPTISSLDPSSAAAGGPAFTLTVNGSGFRSGAAVQWNGSVVSTSFLSSTQLAALVPATLIASPGTASITVVSEGVTSNSASFTIAARPTISSLNPSTATAGGPGLILRVGGDGFASGAAVQWNGTTLATSFVSPTQLTASVPANLIATAGTAQITVASGSVTSNAVGFTIVAGPTISSLDPSSATAGGPAFTLTVNGSGFQSGAAVQWNGVALPTNFASATQLTAPVPASLIASPGTVSVTIVSGSATSNITSFTISGGNPTISSLSPTTVTTGGSGFTLTVSGSGFTSGAVVQWDDSPLLTTFVSGTQLTASVPANLIASPGTSRVTVTNPGGLSSNAAPFSTTPLAIPAITLTGLPPTLVPTQPTSVGVELVAPAPTTLEGSVVLSFRPNTTALPADYRDPAMQFASGGTTLNFVIPPGGQVAVLPQNGAIQQGTVAGTIVVTLTRLLAGSTNVLPQPALTRTVTVPNLAPVIVSNSVRIVNFTSTGFEVELAAYSTPRDLSSAMFSFTVAPEYQIESSTTFSVDIRDVFTQWYDSETGRANGSAFRMRVRFTFDGDANALQAVSVTLTNSVGNSNSVSGGR